jgi:hypothetical protein
MPSEPAYVRAFKELIKTGLTEGHVDDLIGEMYGQDRATIILCTTTVDETISETIQFLLRRHGIVRELFEPDGALGAFASKISLAFGMKIFDIKTKHDLDLIRLLRNGCAHSHVPLRFTTKEVSDVCAHLLLPDLDFGGVPGDFRQICPDIADDKAHPKTRFVKSCSMIWTALMRAFPLGPPEKPPKLPVLP